MTLKIVRFSDQSGARLTPDQTLNSEDAGSRRVIVCVSNRCLGDTNSNVNEPGSAYRLEITVPKNPIQIAGIVPKDGAADD